MNISNIRERRTQPVKTVKLKARPVAQQPLKKTERAKSNSSLILKAGIGLGLIAYAWALIRSAK